MHDTVCISPVDGARALVDRARFPADAPGSPYPMPQALIRVDHSMRVMIDEGFGPVVGIRKVGPDEEAIRLMNDSPDGLMASVWTSDEAMTRPKSYHLRIAI